MTIATRHHWHHPPPAVPSVPPQRRYNPFGIGVAIVLLGAAMSYVATQLSDSRACITVSTWARQDQTSGYWHVGGVPVGWSKPGDTSCIVEVGE